MFMRNWDGSDEAGEGVCALTEDLESARATAQQLGIPLQVADFSRQYWNHVFEPFLACYAAGATPNPDVLCNRHIKFGAFKRYAEEQLGAPFVATGHYAQLHPAVPWWRVPDGVSDSLISLPREHLDANSGSSSTHHSAAPKLLSAIDPIKDQSDFLSFVPGTALKRVIFPVGGLHKSHVRDIAASAGLMPASRRDSYGICFIGKRSLPDFLNEYMTMTPGRFIDITTGQIVGSHSGAEAWTCGQKARLGGKSEKYYVAGRGVPSAGSSGSVDRSNTAAGSVWVAPGRHHPSLYFDSLVIPYDSFMWVGGAPPQEIINAAESAKKQAGFDSSSSTGAAPSTDGSAADAVPLRVRYRIRHRQDDMGSASLSVMTRQQYEEAERANAVGSSAQAAMRTWRLNDPPRVEWQQPGEGTHLTDSNAANDNDSDQQQLLLVVRFSVAQRAVSAGQVLVLYEDSAGNNVNTGAKGVTLEAVQSPWILHQQQSPGTAASSPTGNAVVTTWQHANRVCYGGGVILASGPSYWQRSLPQPVLWRE